jgi:VacB/RNase II family 3'-5' exoribonuclease
MEQRKDREQMNKRPSENHDTGTDGSHRDILQRIAWQAMQDRGFLTDFPAAAMSGIGIMQEAVIHPGGGLRDCRDLAWCSIDNDDSEDLDQLSVAVTIPGGTKILIAIADVDALVGKASAFEDHARHNTTSVYTSARIFPMLPERFSTDLTSLKADADRLAIVVEFAVADDGSVGDSDIYTAAVRNKAKLAYNSVGAWLDGDGPQPAGIGKVDGLEQNLQLQFAMAQKLKTLRYQHGALYLESIEARPVFDGNEVKDLREEKSNSAKDIIAEFMIAANGVTARFLGSKKLPSLRRVVRVPKRWDRIVALAADWKFTLPQEPDSKALDQFLLSAKAKDPIRFPDLSLSVIKLLGAGEYVVELPGSDTGGHFGLAVKDYTHSTAPNRRYPDLITQRLLKAALSAKPAPYGVDELTALASHCTSKEDDAKKVERQVEKSTAALLLHARVGEQFDAIVTGASDKGTWARVFHPPVEGRIVSGFQGLDVGQSVRVQLVHTDVERGFIDFKRV